MTHVLPHRLLDNPEVQDNFDDIENTLQEINTVKAFPKNPSDGQIIYYQDAVLEANANVVWAFRYSAKATNNKWIFVGGGPWFGFGGDITTASVANVAMTGGPTFTATIPGEYMIDLALTMVPTAGGFNIATILANAAETSCAVLLNFPGAFQWLGRGQMIPYGLAAGEKFGIFVKSLGGTNTRFVNASLTVIPRRVGG